MVIDKKIIVGLPAWNISGPCIFAERLVRGLRGRGMDASTIIAINSSYTFVIRFSVCLYEIAFSRVPKWQKQ